MNRKMTAVDMKNDVKDKYNLKIDIAAIKIF